MNNHIPEFVWPGFIPGQIAAFTLIVTFFFLLICETIKPRDKTSLKIKRRSYKTNLLLFALNSVAMSMISISTLLQWLEPFSSQLLMSLSNPMVSGLLSFLILDLVVYGWHVGVHYYEAFWAFHKVHHNDLSINVSTAFRIHIVELFLLNALKTFAIIALGIDVSIAIASELLTTLAVMFHHTNATFKGERLISKIFIVPSLHKTHHSIHRQEHDSNFGAIFSIWDRLFGTIIEAKSEKVGLKGKSPQRLFSLLAFGFKRQPSVQYPVPVEAMINVAAYYEAEKRGFLVGDDWRDWFVAQRQIEIKLYGPHIVKCRPGWLIALDWLKTAFSTRLCLSHRLQECN